MIKCLVIEQFDLKEYDKLKNIVRRCANKYGTLYVGDKFECDTELAQYLMGNNHLKKKVVKILEVIPEKKEQFEKPSKTEKTIKSAKEKTSKK